MSLDLGDAAVKRKEARQGCSKQAAEPIGIYENFFDLGGHSLLVPQLLTQIEEVFQVK